MICAALFLPTIGGFAFAANLLAQQPSTSTELESKQEDIKGKREQRLTDEHSPSQPMPNLPVLKILGQPQSTVNKTLGTPSKHWTIDEPEKRAGGITNTYPIGRELFVDFYRGKAVWVSLSFWEPFCASEAELFAVLGLPRTRFQKIYEDRLSSSFRGTVDNRTIEILAMHQGGGREFCTGVNVELIK